jgi:hypothetical protein
VTLSLEEKSEQNQTKAKLILFLSFFKNIIKPDPHQVFSFVIQKGFSLLFVSVILPLNHLVEGKPHGLAL